MKRLLFSKMSVGSSWPDLLLSAAHDGTVFPLLSYGHSVEVLGKNTALQENVSPRRGRTGCSRG